MTDFKHLSVTIFALIYVNCIGHALAAGLKLSYVIFSSNFKGICIVRHVRVCKWDFYPILSIIHQRSFQDMLWSKPLTSLYFVSTDFEYLVWSLQISGWRVSWIEYEARLNIQHLESFTPHAIDAPSSEALQALTHLVSIIRHNQHFLNSTAAALRSYTSAISSASASSAPFTDVKLSDYLNEGKAKVSQALNNVIWMAEFAAQRYTEIDRDLNIQITRIMSASGARVASAVIEARDEMTETIPDGASRVDTVRIVADEAIASVQLHLQRIKQELIRVSTGGWGLTPYLTSFTTAP